MRFWVCQENEEVWFLLLRFDVSGFAICYRIAQLEDLLARFWAATHHK